mmetsp:Transcript_44493/g.123123  ORF Transcript_44493/g.123123 Transcript_44493/m.123123 type:complete len:205 (+) Transcript_44493:970-1584(+)
MRGLPPIAPNELGNSKYLRTAFAWTLLTCFSRPSCNGKSRRTECGHLSAAGADDGDGVSAGDELPLCPDPMPAQRPKGQPGEDSITDFVHNPPRALCVSSAPNSTSIAAGGNGLQSRSPRDHVFPPTSEEPRKSQKLPTMTSASAARASSNSPPESPHEQSAASCIAARRGDRDARLIVVLTISNSSSRGSPMDPPTHRALSTW